jgi:hypothetical protein
VVHVVSGGGGVEAFGKGSVCSETKFVVAVVFGLKGGRGKCVQLGHLGDTTSNGRGDHASGACWRSESLKEGYVFRAHCQGLDVGLLFRTDVLCYQRFNIISIVALILRVERNAAFNARSREGGKRDGHARGHFKVEQEISGQEGDELGGLGTHI